jgi:hypothetical protein
VILPLLAHCSYCEKEYEKLGALKYCSKECKDKAGTKTFVCEWCSHDFQRKHIGNAKYRFCGSSCASKHKRSLNNPMHNIEYRNKMKQTLKRLGHKPKVQGGNGRGTTLPQEIVLNMLKNDWIVEYVLVLGIYGGKEYPNHYKIDIANPSLKIAIEIDGASHQAIERKVQDRKKENKLKEMGWKVIRFKNNEVLNDPFNCLEELKCLMG